MGKIKPLIRPNNTLPRLAKYCGLIKKRRNKMVERSEFKGKPVLVIKRDENDQYPFSFGLSKAKLILENIDEIKKFVSEAEVKQ